MGRNSGHSSAQVSGEQRLFSGELSYMPRAACLCEQQVEVTPFSFRAQAVQRVPGLWVPCPGCCVVASQQAAWSLGATWLPVARNGPAREETLNRALISMTRCLGSCRSPTLNHHTACIQSCSKLNLEKDVSSCAKLIGLPGLNPVWLCCSQWQWRAGVMAVASPTSWGHCHSSALLLNPPTTHLPAQAALAACWYGSGKCC